MYKTVIGLILRRRKFGEANAYLTALTQDGLITFAAYGVFSHRNKNFASCQPYTLCELVLSYKGENAHLSEASAISHLIKQGIDFEHLSLANYISSMACETNFSNEDAPAIYSLTCTALSLIGKGEIPCNIIKAVFEFRLTASLGFMPDLTACAICQGSHDGGLFSPSLGGVVCAKCTPNKNIPGTQMSPVLISALKHIFSLNDRESFGIRFSGKELLDVFCEAAEKYALEHLECAITALNFYKQNLDNFSV